MTPKTIIFMGPQGSGKGTQVQLLEEKLQRDSEPSVVVVQTGQLFRDLAAEGSYAGDRVKALIEVGDLVPDSFTNAMWISDMRDRVTASSHLLIDGFPRTLVQAAVVDEMLAFFARPDAVVINLDTPKDVVIERMVERGRSDDTPEAIEHRLAQYEADTLPVLRHYAALEGVNVHNIDGSQSVEEVQAAICAALEV